MKVIMNYASLSTFILDKFKKDPTCIKKQLQPCKKFYCPVVYNEGEKTTQLKLIISKKYKSQSNQILEILEFGF